MNKDNLLIVAMAEQCRALLESSNAADRGLPQALHSKHLVWMCNRIVNDAEKWPATKLHRWIGFIQCAMLANRMIDIERAKSMFDDAKNAFGSSAEDMDLLDHLGPARNCEIDIGGQG